MRKMKISLIAITILCIAMLLQGCTPLKEGETSKEVSLNSSGTTLKVVLKADTTQNYEWKYFIANGNLTKKGTNVYKDFLSGTNIEEYAFGMEEDKEETFTCILIHNGAKEAAKAYVYHIGKNDEGDMVLTQEDEKTVGFYPELMSLLEE